MTEDADRTLLARRQRALGPAYRLFYRQPLHVVRGEGMHLFDADGEEYLDAYNNVPCVGHSHPRVIEAVDAQMRRVNTNTRYLQDGVVDYAERLLATLPAAIGRLMLTCSGSEANDLALRVATSVTGHQGIIVTANAYHGVTQAVAAISPSLGEGVGLGAHVRTIPTPDLWRSGLATEAFTEAMVHHVRDAAADLIRHGHGVAALVVDAVFSSDGVHSDPTGWLTPAAEVVRSLGGLYVADEVQAGFGRLGEGMWGFDRHGVVPDIVTMGKPMGNGFPIAAAAFRPELLEDFGRRSRYFNTFGGNSVSVAAAGAVLDVIEDDGLITHAAEVGAGLRAGLDEIANACGQVGGVRGTGLFYGLDLVTDPGSTTPDPGLASAVVDGLRERHVLIGSSGPAGNVLKIRPPLVCTAGDATRLLDELAAVLGRAR
ncbi:aspartate aminotransferase family protein [Raineyella sp. W15-4]|uniref:aspartate aminotransferase family protein n=1 Tax=Raineyella sp. W15-4 TaxID=3081651 RepID=UPI002953FFBD|nr:aspartate aminotransferase family protein [Raineyella sp. W15-4]WOQ15780.1 aspartate aminotransferase family protein [Raineyella sp. W15-4]